MLAEILVSTVQPCEPASLIVANLPRLRAFLPYSTLPLRQATAARFVATVDGTYSFSANIRIDGATTGTFRAIIAKLGKNDANLGRAAINSDPSNSYDNIVIGGLFSLKKNEYVSVFVYSGSDNSWAVNHESGFSGAYVGPVNQEGFQADMAADSATHGTGWFRTENWRQIWSKTTSFATATGRYTAPADSAYLINMNARIDSGATGYFRMITSWNNQRDVENSMSAMDGNIASSYETFVIAGVLQLNKGDYIEQYVYSNSDNSWKVQNQAGFSVTQLHQQSAIGFRADKTGCVDRRVSWSSLALRATCFRPHNLYAQVPVHIW